MRQMNSFQLFGFFVVMAFTSLFRPKIGQEMIDHAGVGFDVMNPPNMQRFNSMAQFVTQMQMEYDALSTKDLKQHMEQNGKEYTHLTRDEMITELVNMEAYAFTHLYENYYSSFCGHRRHCCYLSSGWCLWHWKFLHVLRRK